MQLSNGMKSHVAKVKRRSALPGSRIHRTAAESSQDRMRKKLIGKINWFKGRNFKKYPEPGCGALGSSQDGRQR